LMERSIMGIRWLLNFYNGARTGASSIGELEATGSGRSYG
jgi:hypothetical protein